MYQLAGVRRLEAQRAEAAPALLRDRASWWHYLSNIYVYIYIYVERERDIDMYIRISLLSRRAGHAAAPPRPSAGSREGPRLSKSCGSRRLSEGLFVTRAVLFSSKPLSGTGASKTILQYHILNIICYKLLYYTIYYHNICIHNIYIYVCMYIYIYIERERYMYI